MGGLRLATLGWRQAELLLSTTSAGAEVSAVREASPIPILSIHLASGSRPSSELVASRSVAGFALLPGVKTGKDGNMLIAAFTSSSKPICPVACAPAPGDAPAADVSSVSSSLDTAFGSVTDGTPFESDESSTELAFGGDVPRAILAAVRQELAKRS